MKKTIFLVLILIFAKSQSQSLDQGTINSKDYFAEIPFDYINGKIIIPVEINSKTYRFILDTGAPNVLSKGLSNLINPGLQKSVNVTDANNKTSNMGLVAIPELTIGNIVFQNSSALVFQEDKNLVFDCFQVDGFIGSNLFRNSIVQIDAKSKILRITNDKNLLTYNKNNKQKVKLIGAQKSPYISVLLGKDGIGKEWLLFDTGMSDFYDLSKQHYQIFKKYNVFQDLATGQGSDGLGMFGHEIETTKHKCLLSEFKIGNLEFKNLQVITTNDDNSRIGTGVLNYSIVTLDFKEKRIYFDLNPEFTNQPFIDLTKRVQPISMTIANDKLVVGIIWDKEFLSKIAVGDAITNINGVNYENKDVCKVIAGKSAMKSNEKNEITVKTKTGEYIKLSL